MTVPQAADGAETVTTTERLTDVISHASRSRLVGLDIESNGFHRYPERVCLVQLAAGGSAFLIDPLATPDMGPLGKLLADSSVEKVLHSADYDLRSLDRDWGFRISNLFDTSVAAAFAGSAGLGLAAVLQEYLGVEVPKSKRLQRADWTLRPLSEEARLYAASDVLHLERARDLLVERLDGLSRLPWVTEECGRLAETRYRPPDAAWAFLKMKGSRALDGRGLAVLRSLHRFREREAVRRDRPPFKVLSDAVLVGLAASPHSSLETVTGLGRYGRPGSAKSLRAALHDGLRDGPVGRPPRKPQNNRRLRGEERVKAAERLKRAKSWRTGLGLQLGLDPALLWPARSLERLAGWRNSIDEEFESIDVRSWQRQEFGDSLRTLFAGLD
jgi:ribonuclease D